MPNDGRGEGGEGVDLAGAYEQGQTSRGGKKLDGQGEDGIEVFYGSQGDDIG